MVSLITASYSSAHFTVSRQPHSRLNPPPRFFSVGWVISPPKRHHLLRLKRKRVKQDKQNHLLFEFSDCCGVVRMCRREGGGDQVELELLEFMKNSKNPELFPSKRDLIKSGRADLAEAIEKTGGWMSMGWEDDEDEKEELEDGSARNWGFDEGQNGCEVEARSGSQLSEDQDLEGISFAGNSSPAASSSGRPLEVAAEGESGIEGILNRLERERSLSFGLNVDNNGSINHVSVAIGKDGQSAGMPKDAENHCHTERNDAASLGRQFSDRMKRSYYMPNSTVRADTWRSWSIKRAGVSNTEFEAAEIDFGGSTNGRTTNTSGNTNGRTVDTSGNTNGRIVDTSGNTNGRTVNRTAGEIIVVTTDNKEPLDRTKDLDSGVEEINQSDVKTRLQDLELELSSVLRSLRPNTSGLPEKAKEHMSEDLRKLSDTSEFRENEIMIAQEKLRSIRAKIAVLEGKMALAITDAQKLLDVKQKRIYNARRALQLLRTTCMVWPNSASEVLLAGSFDGWATQRKMEKLSTGGFSLSLKLYPGQYEIKFIVDGIWKVDPLRPIVNSGGFENNLLIVT